MVGGQVEAVAQVEPILKVLAPAPDKGGCTVARSVRADLSD